MNNENKIICFYLMIIAIVSLFVDQYDIAIFSVGAIAGVIKQWQLT